MSSTMSLESGRVMSSSCKAKISYYVGCWSRAGRDTWPAYIGCGAGHSCKGSGVQSGNRRRVWEYSRTAE